MRSIAALLAILLLTTTVPTEGPRPSAEAVSARPAALPGRAHRSARRRRPRRATTRPDLAESAASRARRAVAGLTPAEPDLTTHSTIALLRFATDDRSATDADKAAVHDEIRSRGAAAARELAPLLALERNQLRSLAHAGLVALGERALPLVLASAQHEDDVTRNYALSVLWELVEEGSLSAVSRVRVVHAALVATRDSYEDNRGLAAQVLAALPEALPVLTSHLNNGSERERQAAMLALSWADWDEHPARGVLERAARDPSQSEGVRLAAAHWLAEEAAAESPIDTLPRLDGVPAVRLWALAMAAGDEEHGAPALEALRARSAEARTLFLETARTVDDPDIAEHAVAYLALLGDEPPAIWLEVIRSAGSSHARWQAFCVLEEFTEEGRIGDVAPALRALCIEFIDDPDEDVRLSAACALGELYDAGFDTASDLVRALGGPAAAAAADVLSEMEHWEDPEVWAALATLEAESPLQADHWQDALDEPDPERAVHAIAAFLGDPDDDVVRKAAEALGDLDERAHAAVPALEAALVDRYGSVRLAVAFALGDIGDAGKRALPALTNAFRRTLRSTVRDRLIHVLEELEWRPEQVDVPILVGMTARRRQGCGRWRCRAALRALEKLGQAAAAATPTLLAAAELQQHEDLERTIEALGRISFGEPEVLRLLVTALEGDDLFYGCTSAYNVPAAAATALSHIRVSTPETRRALEAALAHENAVVRKAAATTISTW